MNVLIADDYPLVRKGLHATLSFEEGVEKVDEASNVDEAVRILSTIRPEISIIDSKLGNEDGLQIITKARTKNISSRFIVLASSNNKDDFRRAQEMGVDAYILKKAFVEDIIYAFHTVRRGKKFFDFDIMHKDIDRGNVDKLKELTLRERDVLIEIGKGLNNTQIAKSLFISDNTVKKHISNIFQKLGLNHRTEAALLINKLVKIGVETNEK